MKKITIRLLFLLIFLSWASAYAQKKPKPQQSAPLYFPSVGQWETKAPEVLGLDAGRLAQAVEFAQANEYKGERDLRLAILKAYASEPYHEIVGPTRERGGPAGLIIKNGYIVAQWGDIQRADMCFSVTKSYVATVAGLAVDAGLIRSVQDTVAQYVWDGTFRGAHNGRITWHHLLNQSSDWSGDLFGMPDWSDRPPRTGGIDEWKNRALNPPGTVYEYNDVRVNLLAYSLLQVWRKPLPAVLKERVMDPIGASTTWRWYGYENSYVNVDGVMVQSVSGGGHSGGGIFASTLDHARFGLLFARKGNWAGRQLVSESWISAMQQPSEANPNYGYLWWLNGAKAWPDVAPHVYHAAGFGGNFIVVDEQNDLVIVYRWLDPPKVGEAVKKVMEAMGR